MTHANMVTRMRIAWRVAIAVWMLIGIYLAIRTWWKDIKHTVDVILRSF